MSDQHRYDYYGAAGAEFVRTPNLDKLAERGMRFSHCCTNAPVCSPARIGLASGLQPSRLGSLDNNSFLPHNTKTYYQRLRDHGYRVGLIGKSDLAKPDRYNGRYGDRPSGYTYGFTHPEECEGKMHAGNTPGPVGPYTFYLQEKGLYKKFQDDYLLRQSRGWIRNASHDSALPAEDFEDIYIGRRATQWIENIPDDFPWHLFVSFVGPHDPFDPPKEYADRYREADMPEHIHDEHNGKPAWVKKRALDCSSEETRLHRQQYCALVELIDEQIGHILEALEKRGMLDHTVIIYSSDHGEMLGDHGLYQKSFAYESALRVPLIIDGPGVESGKATDTLVELIDINPTICELAGLPAQENIDAKSLVPVLRGSTGLHRDNTIAALRHLRCIRTRTHKLIDCYNDICELYDLENDPDELNNIADDNPEIVRELRQLMSKRFTEGKHLR